MDGQKRAGQRPPFSAPPVLAPLPAARYQPRSLQRLFHPAVADLQSMLFGQLLVKMSHAQVEVSLPIQPQHQLGRLHRYPIDTPPLPTLVEQSRIAELL